MWDLPHLVQLKKARSALKKGRLDEAYEIATDPEYRDYRQCQDLLQQLVPGLLDRARVHLEAGRTEDALADIARAQKAGGNQTEIAELRQKTLAMIQSEHREARQVEENAVRDVRKEEAILQSVRGHIDAGRLTEGAARLAEAGRTGNAGLTENAGASDDQVNGSGEPVGVDKLGREIKRRRFEADQACLQIGRLLEENNVAAAIDSAIVLHKIAREEPQAQVILARIGKESSAMVLAALTKGSLQQAESLVHKLSRLDPPGFDRTRHEETLSECRKAALAVSHGNWSVARIHLARLRRALPEASWVAESEESARAVEDGLREIRGGPLGVFASHHPETVNPEAASPETHEDGTSVSADGDTATISTLATVAAISPSDAATPGPPENGMSTQHRVLWIDSVGSFLLLQGSRTTIGRLGSSMSPDIALPADIDGVHAEILRIDHDYFLAPRGSTNVGGKPVKQRLLADGDLIDLDGRVKLKFRLPTALSSTAVLELPRTMRLGSDIRRIILADSHVILGASTVCHIETPHAPERVILSLNSKENGLRCRHEAGVLVDGEDAGVDAEIPLGAHVEAGELTFTITALPQPTPGQTPRRGDTS